MPNLNYSDTVNDTNDTKLDINIVSLADDSLNIIALIEKNPNITVTQISNILKISRSTTLKVIKALQNSNVFLFNFNQHNINI